MVPNFFPNGASKLTESAHEGLHKGFLSASPGAFKPGFMTNPDALRRTPVNHRHSEYSIRESQKSNKLFTYSYFKLQDGYA